MKKNKRYLALLAALMMLVFGTACGSEDSSAKSGPSAEENTASAADTSSAEETASAPDDSSEEETEPPAEELPAMDSAYKVLDCLDAEGKAAYICSCGNNAVIQCISADKEDRIVVKYYVVDAVKDELLRTIDNCDPFETLLGIDAEGNVTAQDNSGDTQKLIYYKTDGSRIVNGSDNIIDDLRADTSGQLYDLDKGIVSINSDGSRQVIFDNEETEGVELYDALRNRAVADYCNESFTVSRKLVLVDTSTGSEISELGAASVADVKSAGDYIAVTCTSDDDSDERICSVYEKETGKLAGTYALKDMATGYSFSDGSSYGIAAERTEDSDTLDLDFLRLSDGATGRISAEIPDATGAISTGITSADRFLSAVAVKGSADDKYNVRLVMTDPGQVDFDGFLDKADPLEFPEDKDYKCGEEYSDLRAEADSIEEKYGIRILIGDEVLDIEDVNYSIEIISGESGTASKYAYESAESALETFGDTLAKYPEGFFEKFKRNGKGGLCIALCDSFKNWFDEDGFSPGGFTMPYGAWEIIAISTVEVDSQTANIIHHEMLHAVEDIVSRKIGLIDEDEWAALNPEGFEYSADFDAYADGDTSSDLIYGSDDDPYFYNEYGKVDPFEDRATLIEGLFTDAYASSPDDMTYIEDITEKCPHLKAKYDLLADWTEQLFGYVYWEEMLGVDL